MYLRHISGIAGVVLATCVVHGQNRHEQVQQARLHYCHNLVHSIVSESLQLPDIQREVVLANALDVFCSIHEYGEAAAVAATVHSPQIRRTLLRTATNQAVLAGDLAAVEGLLQQSDVSTCEAYTQVAEQLGLSIGQVATEQLLALNQTGVSAEQEGRRSLLLALLSEPVGAAEQLRKAEFLLGPMAAEQANRYSYLRAMVASADLSRARDFAAANGFALAIDDAITDVAVAHARRGNKAGAFALVPEIRTERARVQAMDGVCNELSSLGLLDVTDRDTFPVISSNSEMMILWSEAICSTIAVDGKNSPPSVILPTLRDDMDRLCVLRGFLRQVRGDANSTIEACGGRQQVFCDAEGVGKGCAASVYSAFCAYDCANGNLATAIDEWLLAAAALKMSARPMGNVTQCSRDEPILELAVTGCRLGLREQSAEAVRFCEEWLSKARGGLLGDEIATYVRAIGASWIALQNHAEAERIVRLESESAPRLALATELVTWSLAEQGLEESFSYVDRLAAPMTAFEQLLIKCQWAREAVAVSAK